MTLTEFMSGIALGGTVGIIAGYIAVMRQRKIDAMYKLDMFRQKRRTILRHVVYQTGAINAIVLKIHNGGSKLEESHEWYSSVIDEAPTAEAFSSRRVWQNVVVDDQYRDMIREVRSKDRKFLFVDEMSQSFLRRTYKRLGINGSLVMQVHEDENFFYYCSFALRDMDKLVDDEAEVNTFENARLALMRLYQEYHAYDILRLDWGSPI